MSEFKNISTLLIPTSSCQSSYLSSPVVIFPDEILSEEPLSMEDDGNSYSYIDRRVDRYRKLRAMHERAGRLPKSPVSENNNGSRNTSTSSSRSNCSNFSDCSNNNSTEN